MIIVNTGARLLTARQHTPADVPGEAPIVAAHLDLAGRLEAAGVEHELYSSAPAKDLATIAGYVKRGAYPVAVNVKGAKADDVLIVVSLAAWESMQPSTGFEDAE